ncbi:hypothetical protein IF650_13100 [Cellulosimicrobium terreum]|nr:hypothetical protein [Cellulosimicrobium terreum]
MSTASEEAKSRIDQLAEEIEHGTGFRPAAGVAGDLLLALAGREITFVSGSLDASKRTTTGTFFLFTTDLLVRVRLVEARSAWGAAPGHVDPSGQTVIDFIPRSMLIGVTLTFPGWSGTRYSGHDELVAWRWGVELNASYRGFDNPVVIREQDNERFGDLYSALLSDLSAE